MKEFCRERKFWPLLALAALAAIALALASVGDASVASAGDVPIAPADNPEPAQAAADFYYDFESLNLNQPLIGQDGWVTSGVPGRSGRGPNRTWRQRHQGCQG